MKFSNAISALLLGCILALCNGCSVLSQASEQVAGVTGVTLPSNYCELPGTVRCSLEQRIEDQVNEGVEKIGDTAVVNVDVICPNDAPAFCKAPSIDTGQEAGDYQLVRATVNGIP